jgi:hypothetical protein
MDKSHTIYRLPVHTPNGQSVNFQLNMANIREALDAARCTALTDYFALNARDREARNLYYLQIPIHYTWKAQEKRWKQRERQADKVVARMFHIGPQMGELFFLRLLLLHVRGACSFDELKTVDGVVFNTFRDACIQRELVDDDRIWRETLDEVITFQMPTQLRATFASICHFGQPSDPNALFEQALPHMREDFENKYPNRDTHTNDWITNQVTRKLISCVKNIF